MEEAKTLSDQEWFEAMHAAEDRLIRLSGLGLSQVKKSFITIQVAEGPFRVRVFEIGDKSKETLVLTHGFSACALSYYTMLKTLSEKYRLVLFDNASWGLNTRLKECSGMQSPAKAEAWLIDWLVKVF